MKKMYYIYGIFFLSMLTACTDKEELAYKSCIASAKSFNSKLSTMLSSDGFIDDVLNSTNSLSNELLKFKTEFTDSKHLVKIDSILKASDQLEAEFRKLSKVYNFSDIRAFKSLSELSQDVSSYKRFINDTKLSEKIKQPINQRFTCDVATIIQNNSFIKNDFQNKVKNVAKQFSNKVFMRARNDERSSNIENKGAVGDCTIEEINNGLNFSQVYLVSKKVSTFGKVVNFFSKAVLNVATFSIAGDLVGDLVKDRDILYKVSGHSAIDLDNLDLLTVNSVSIEKIDY